MAFATHPKQTLIIEIGSLRQFSDIAGRHVVRFDNSVDQREDIMNRLGTAGCAVAVHGTEWHAAGRAKFDAVLARAHEFLGVAVPAATRVTPPSRKDRNRAYDKLQELSEKIIQGRPLTLAEYEKWKDASDAAIRVAGEPTASFLRDRLDPTVRTYGELAVTAFDEYGTEKLRELAHLMVSAGALLTEFRSVRVKER